MAKRILRVYADTSVFGGVFDEEFSDGSRTFFDQVRAGRFLLATSATVEEEIAAAPIHVRRLFETAPVAEVLEVTGAALDLRAAYLQAGIVPPKSRTDALHVALATIDGCSLVVSWNFAHIVHFEKIPLYNKVNALKGYGPIAIYSPLEVIDYENQDL